MDMGCALIMGAGSGGIVDLAGNPVGETPVLRSRLSGGIIFDDNSISATDPGTLTHNTTGGPNNGPYISGWLWSSGKWIAHNGLTTNNASSSSWLTLVAWARTSDTAAGGTYSPRKTLFGWDSGSRFAEWGKSDGNVHIPNGSATADGTASVADGNWHLIIYQQNGQNTWNIWVDNVKDVDTVTKSGSPANIQVHGVGRGHSSGNGAPDIGPFQIYLGQLTDSQVQEIFAQAGF